MCFCNLFESWNRIAGYIQGDAEILTSFEKKMQFLLFYN